MFDWLFDRWKQEWWLKHAAEIAHGYQHRQEDLLRRLEAELQERQCKIEVEIRRGKVLEEEVTYRTKVLEERKLELIQADNDLKNQIKVLEAKAHPSTVYVEAFSQGVSKSLDMLMPIMSENLEKFKTKLKDDAIAEAIKRLKR